MRILQGPSVNEGPHSADCILPPPRPGDLITVPCCLRCNRSFGRDDEYVPAIIQLREDVSKSPQAQGSLASVLRGLERGKAGGFRAGLAEALMQAKVLSRSGLFLGTRDALLIDRVRLDSFVARVARGLSYRTFSQPVPAEFVVTPVGILEAAPELASWLDGLTWTGLADVGHGILRYAWSQASDSPMSTIWLMVFYGLVPFGAIVRDSQCPQPAQH